MKRIFRLAPMVVLAMLATSLGGCHSDSDIRVPVKIDSTSDSQTVAVTHPTHEDLSRSVSLTAEFRPYQEVEVHARGCGLR